MHIVEIIGMIILIFFVGFLGSRNKFSGESDAGRHENDVRLHDPSTVDGLLFHRNMSPPREDGKVNDYVEWR